MGGASGTATGSEGYKPSPSLAICILCGWSPPLSDCDQGSDGERREKEQQAQQRLGRLTSKAVEECAGQSPGRHRRHEAGALRLPQRSQGKVGLPPPAPAFQRPDRNPRSRLKPRCRWCLPGMPGRHQHHRQSKVHAPSEKAYRHRGAPFAAHAAAETEARVVIVLRFRQARSRFARIVGAVENAVTEKTSVSTRLRRQRLIDPLQQLKKLGVLQQGMAHFGGLLASKPETPPKGSFVQVPRGGSPL
ncbi:MAG: hypothetical protein Q8M12_03950, partial [bacterium]|nr:hypothetical protein [bacterium]